ncbi:sulfotransferase 2B1-like isoform X2 [Carettochelys insculpta]|uniref:sulfotransferase 2B1-like isoform X2 n=1 Tax=Carettochelys insculpta TaxID=44489 RepID=UPI003EB9251E
MFKDYFQYKGISFPRVIYSEQGLQAAENKFQVRDDDIFNVTYQKSGTVWMLEILSLIRSNGDPSWCRTVPNWDRGPWYETNLGLRTAQGNQSPRIISSHLPIHLFAKSFFQSKAKVLYTVRNPKDVVVSLYHFSQIFRPYKCPGQLDQFLEQFLEGDVPFGSWFDHVKGWLELRDCENFFWISYEELHQFPHPQSGPWGGPATTDPCPCPCPHPGPAGQRGADLQVPGQGPGHAGAGGRGGERLLPGHEAEQDEQLQLVPQLLPGPNQELLPAERDHWGLEEPSHSSTD